ncbi:MAG: hypothetical protein HFE63_03815 [Clostridiales bacterium]|nr:hypothetical protein [Clostridiales bacterium]
MSLSKLEQETIILFNEDEKIANIQTYNGALKRKLSDLCVTRPNEAVHTRTDQYGGMYFTIPKKWVKVNAGVILSDEQRSAMAERAKQRFSR